MATEKVIKCATPEKARRVNAANWVAFRNRASRAGYTEDANGNIIGRNAATGLPAPHKNTIKRWDVDGRIDEVDNKPIVRELPPIPDEVKNFLTPAELVALEAEELAALEDADGDRAHTDYTAPDNQDTQ